MSVFILKILALLFMIIDHIGYFFITNETYLTYRLIGRLAAPIFLFLFVEGFIKTSNRKKYQTRLFIAGIVMYIGNIILSLFCSKMYPLNTNIIFTIFLCSVYLTLIENKNINKYIKLLLLIIGLVPFKFVEYSYLAIGCSILFYFYLIKIEDKKISKNNKNYIKTIFVGTYVIFSILYCMLTQNYVELFMIFSIIPIILYNFKLGKKNLFIKYFYYIFYIGHLWLFVLIKNFVI